MPSNVSFRTNTQFFDFLLQDVRDALRGPRVPVQPAETDLAGASLETEDVHLELGLSLLHVELEGEKV